MTVSGFNLDNFTFYGFFPRKLKDKKDLLKKISLSTSPSVLFESGRRIEKLFNFLKEELEENCPILVAREITKMHETFYRGNLQNIKEILSESEFGSTGEFVIVINGITKINKSNISENDSRILDILMNKLDKKLALEIGSEILNKKRNELYKIKLKD